VEFLHQDLSRGSPLAWLGDGKKIEISNSPRQFCFILIYYWSYDESFGAMPTMF
jgi:hypothetical protein